MRLRVILILLLVLGSEFRVTQAKDSPIKRVIVLCMENQSYDHILGWMGRPVSDLTGEEYNPLNPNIEGSEKIYVKKGAPFRISPDPPHDFIPTQEQVFGSYWNDGTPEQEEENQMGYIWTYIGYNSDSSAESASKIDPTNIMSLYTPDQVPVISELAKQFTLYNNWYASLPGPTDPNKMFIHAATSNSNTAGCGSWYCLGPGKSGFPMKARTIFENLEDEGYTYDIHYMDWADPIEISPLNENKQAFVQDDDFKILFEKMRTGRLADYTYLVPRFYRGDYWPNSQHPTEDVRYGENMIKNVYENLRASKYWNETILIITYDEHGGFFDSKIPPQNVHNPSPEIPSFPDKFSWDRLGVRVPGIAISPWLKQGIDSRQMEHSSIPKTIKEIFNLSSDFLTVRDREANSLLSEQFLLSAPRTDCPLKLPAIPDFDSIKNLPVEEVPSGEDEYIYLMGSMLVNGKYVTSYELEKAISLIHTEKDSVQFIRESMDIMGYRQNKPVQHRLFPRFLRK